MNRIIDNRRRVNEAFDQYRTKFKNKYPQSPIWKFRHEDSLMVNIVANKIKMLRIVSRDSAQLNYQLLSFDSVILPQQ